MHIFQELKTLMPHIYFKTIVTDNLHLFRKLRRSSPHNSYVNFALVPPKLTLERIEFEISMRNTLSDSKSIHQGNSSGLSLRRY